MPSLYKFEHFTSWRMSTLSFLPLSKKFLYFPAYFHFLSGLFVFFQVYMSLRVDVKSLRILKSPFFTRTEISSYLQWSLSRKSCAFSSTTFSSMPILSNLFYYTGNLVSFGVSNKFRTVLKAWKSSC